MMEVMETSEELDAAKTQSEAGMRPLGRPDHWVPCH